MNPLHLLSEDAWSLVLDEVGVPDLLALTCVCKGFRRILARGWQSKWNRLKALQGVKTPSRRPNKPSLVLLLLPLWIVRTQDARSKVLATYAWVLQRTQGEDMAAAFIRAGGVRENRLAMQEPPCYRRPAWRSETLCVCIHLHFRIQPEHTAKMLIKVFTG